MCKIVSTVSCPLCDQRDSQTVCHICHGSDSVEIDRVSEIVEQSLAWAEKLHEPAPSWIWESGEYIFEDLAFVVAEDMSVTAFDPASCDMPSTPKKIAKRSVASVILLAIAFVAYALAGKRVAA